MTAYSPCDMTLEQFTAAGRALYGERWQTPLAKDLNVADRTIRRWLSGESAIPSGIKDELGVLLSKRFTEIRLMLGFSIKKVN